MFEIHPDLEWCKDEFFDFFSLERPCTDKEKVNTLLTLTVFDMIKRMCQCRGRNCLKKLIDDFKLDMTNDDEEDCYPDDDCDSCHGCRLRDGSHNDSWYRYHWGILPWKDAFAMDTDEKIVCREWLEAMNIIK